MLHFRSYDTFAYIIQVHIHKINMCMYISGAYKHELSSGHVHVHIIGMPGLKGHM